MLLCFRYNNILPYDHTRIKLVNPLDGCDYINANWITTAQAKDEKSTTSSVSQPCSNISFMASQGPLPNTCSHHLQMIHEQKIDIVVMLTRLLEQHGQGNKLYDHTEYSLGTIQF